MIKKLNAEELAAKRYDNGYMHMDDMGRCFDITRRLRECAATTIREVAQPIADERDEYREALTNLVYDIAGEQHDFDEISKAFCPIVATRIQYARAILAKYQKQPNNEHA